MNRIFRGVIVFSILAAAAAAQTSSNHAGGVHSARTPRPLRPKSAQASPRKVDRAAAYYHYTLAHMYEEQVTVYGRSELANKAMEEYRLAIEADPSSEFLTSGLAELYVKTGRIRDAVLQAQDILKRDPNNLEAHKLLGRIYLRSLGDLPGERQRLRERAQAGHRAVRTDRQDRAQQCGRPPSARPPLPPEQ